MFLREHWRHLGFDPDSVWFRENDMQLVRTEPCAFLSFIILFLASSSIVSAEELSKSSWLSLSSKVKHTTERSATLGDKRTEDSSYTDVYLTLSLTPSELSEVTSNCDWSILPTDVVVEYSGLEEELELSEVRTSLLKLKSENISLLNYRYKESSLGYEKYRFSILKLNYSRDNLAAEDCEACCLGGASLSFPLKVGIDMMALENLKLEDDSPLASEGTKNRRRDIAIPFGLFMEVGAELNCDNPVFKGLGAYLSGEVDFLADESASEWGEKFVDKNHDGKDDDNPVLSRYKYKVALRKMICDSEKMSSFVQFAHGRERYNATESENFDSLDRDFTGFEFGLNW